MIVGEPQLQAKSFRLVRLDGALVIGRLAIGTDFFRYGLCIGLLGLITFRDSGLLFLDILLIIAIAKAERIVLRNRGRLDGGQWLPFARFAVR